MEFTHQSVQQYFVERFRQEPLLIRSPGRINLIGEHTDYNDGFVMPAAIDREITYAIAASSTSVSTLCALNFQETITIDIHNPQRVSQPAWANYLLGVIRQLVDRGHVLKPFSCVVGGNIPEGSGLSSSAALECGFAFALNELNALGISKLELARIGQWSEHNFVGVRCGIMDQFANMMGKANHVIQLDCRSLDYHYIPFKLAGYSIVLFNSAVKHSLASSEYNTRRAECEEGVQVLKTRRKEIYSLRDVSLSELESCKALLPANVYSRCRYVIEEIERVQLASIDLQHNDLHAFGIRMTETHEGLSQLYEVSCEELDYLVAMARHHSEVLGSRLMGGGFGGCTINIIQSSAVNRVVSQVMEGYRNRFNIDAESYSVQIEDGTSLISN